MNASTAPHQHTYVGLTCEHGEREHVEELSDVCEGQEALQLDHAGLQAVRVQVLLVLVRPATHTHTYIHTYMGHAIHHIAMRGRVSAVRYLPLHGGAEHAEVRYELHAARLVELEGEQQH